MPSTATRGADSLGTGWLRVRFLDDLNRAPLGRRRQEGVDQPVDPQCGVTGYSRLPAGLDGLDEIEDERLVPGVGEGHGIGAAASAGLLAVPLLAAVAPTHGEHPGAKLGGGVGAVEADFVG